MTVGVSHTRGAVLRSVSRLRQLVDDPAMADRDLRERAIRELESLLVRLRTSDSAIADAEPDDGEFWIAM
jgi:hypothetical protein